MLPCHDDLVSLSKNVDYRDACTLDCRLCDWRTRIEDCMDLAKIELIREAQKVQAND